jgi:hypothetical protein
VALGQRSRTRLAESTAEGAAALRAAGNRERDEAVRAPAGEQLVQAQMPIRPQRCSGFG